MLISSLPNVALIWCLVSRWLQKRYRARTIASHFFVENVTSALVRKEITFGWCWYEAEISQPFSMRFLAIFSLLEWFTWSTLCPGARKTNKYRRYYLGVKPYVEGWKADIQGYLMRIRDEINFVQNNCKKWR